jgi:hypothetical protein
LQNGLIFDTRGRCKRFLGFSHFAQLDLSGDELAVLLQEERVLKGTSRNYIRVIRVVPFHLEKISTPFI